MGEIKQGYKQTEFGLIPEDWKLCTFKDVLSTFSSGATPYRGIPEYYKGEIRWISSGELNYNTINETIEHISELAVKNTNLKTHSPGTFLMAVTGLEAEGTRGRCAIVGLPSTTNQSCLAINSTVRMTTEYLFWFYRQWSEYLAFKYCQGTKQQSYTAALVKELPICCPKKITEQTSIATALSDVDALIATLNKKITKKQQIKQGAMQQLLTGKKRLPGFSGNSEFKQTELGLIPEDWEVKRVDEIFRSLSTATYTRAELGTEGETQCLHYGDIHSLFNEFVDFSFIELPKVIEKRVKNYSLLQDGDIVMADASEDYLGLCKSVEIKNIRNKKAISGLHTILLREKNSVYENGFKGYLFLIPEVRKQLIELATGMKVYGVSKKNLGQVLLPIPSKPEQTTIAQILTDMNNEIVRLEADRNKYEQIKAGMMQQLLTGKIRLTGSIHTTIAIEQTKTVELNSKKQSHTDQINEAVVISFLVNKFSSVQYPLSRFRYTKYSYLLHRQYEHVACGFKKHAAGPYKPENRYKGPENIAIKNKYISKVPNPKSKKDAFLVNRDIDKALVYFNEWYGAEIQQWIEQFRYFRNDDLEALTTVDESICDLENEGKVITVNSIKQYIDSIPQWRDKLKKDCFSDINIQKVINKSRELFS